MDVRRALPVYIIAGTTFAGGLARNFLVPLRAHELGASRLTIGLLATVALIVAAAVSLPSGYVTDRLGRRVALTLSVVFGVTSQLIAAATPSVWPLFVSAVVGGVGLGASQTGLFAALVDTVEGPQVGRAMGWLTFSMQSGFLLGPAVGGLLLAVVSTPVDLALTSLFWLAALPSALRLPSGARSAPWQPADIRAMAARRGFQAALFGVLAIGMVWGTLQAYLPVFGKEALGLPGSQIGYLLAFQAGANGISRLVVGRLSDRFRQQWPLVVAGTAGSSVVMLLLPHLHGFGGPALVLALGVPFSATTFIALSVTFANLSNNENRGLVMGVYSAVLFLGLGAGPAAYGPAIQQSYLLGFTICGLVGIAMAGLVPAVRWLPANAGRHRLEPANPLLERRVGGEEAAQSPPGEGVDDVEVGEGGLRHG